MVPQLVQVGAVSTAEIGVVLALLFKSPTSTSSVDEEFRSHSSSSRVLEYECPCLTLSWFLPISVPCCNCHHYCGGGQCDSTPPPFAAGGGHPSTDGVLAQDGSHPLRECRRDTTDQLSVRQVGAGGIRLRHQSRAHRRLDRNGTPISNGGLYSLFLSLSLPLLYSTQAITTKSWDYHW